MMDLQSYLVLGITLLAVAGILIYTQYLEEMRKKLVKTVESLGGYRYFKFGRYMSGLESNNPVKNVYCIETDDMFHFSTADGKVFGKIDKTDVTSVSAAKAGKVSYYLTIGVKGEEQPGQAIFAFPGLKKTNQGSSDIKQGLKTETAAVK